MQANILSRATNQLVNRVDNAVIEGILMPTVNDIRVAKAASWLRHFIETECDSSDPDEVVSYCFLGDKKSVWRLYCSQVESTAIGGILSYKKFIDLWNAVFPQLKLREDCNICGTCKVPSIV